MKELSQKYLLFQIETILKKTANFKKFLKAEIQKKLLQKILHSSPEINFISTDSRDNLDYKSLFITLQGENFDGSDFVENAYQKGCRNFICSDDKEQKIKKKLQKKINNCNIFFVKNPLLSYGDLAKDYLKKWQGQKIAITGSAGKTSTKFYLTHLLCSQVKVFAGDKNYNNAVGIPKCIFQIDQNYDFYIFEMGMNHSNEISYLSQIVQPDITIITTILTAHIGYFKNEEEIAKAKAEIFEGQNSKGVTFLPEKNKHLPLLKKKAQHLKIYFFDESKFEIAFSLNNFNFETEIQFSLAKKKIKIAYPNFDPFILTNLSIAIAVFEFLAKSFFDCDLIALQNSLQNISHVERRCSEITFNPKIIDDSYNANFDSMILVVLKLLEIVDEKLFIVLGDILELGEKSKFYHLQIAEKLNSFLQKKNKKQNQYFCFYGDHMKNCYEKLNTSHKKYFQTKKELFLFLQENFNKNTIFFFKASNGMGFGEVIKKLKNLK